MSACWSSGMIPASGTWCPREYALICGRSRVRLPDEPNFCSNFGSGESLFGPKPNILPRPGHRAARLLLRQRTHHLRGAGDGAQGQGTHHRRRGGQHLRRPLGRQSLRRPHQQGTSHRGHRRRPVRRAVQPTPRTLRKATGCKTFSESRDLSYPEGVPSVEPWNWSHFALVRTRGSNPWWSEVS